MKELEYLIDKAKVAGAEQADIMHLERKAVDLSYRQGKMENLDRSENSEEHACWVNDCNALTKQVKTDQLQVRHDFVQFEELPITGH